MMQMTWPGAPTVYYGDEAGLCGWTDPDNRRTYPWGQEDKNLLTYHKEMIRIHKDYQMFKTGSLIYLISEPGLIAYGRFTREERSFVVIQTGGSYREIEVEAWRLGMEDGQMMASLMTTDQGGFHLGANMVRVENGRVRIHIGENGGVLYKSIDKFF